jgi:hypothetical protein
MSHPLVLLFSLLSLLVPGVRAAAAPDAAGVIAALSRAVPLFSGWRAFVEGDRLIVQRDAPVWVLGENRISAPVSTESAAERSARIRKHGKRVSPRFAFRVEARWSAARVARVTRENAELGRRIAALGKRHGIQPILDQLAYSKNPDPLRLARTPDEERRVRAYLAERAALQAKLGELPELALGRYSLFSAGREGWSDAMHVVDPPGAAEECYRVERAVRTAIEADRSPPPG